MKKGFLIGGGIVVAGLVLQAAIGPVRWALLAFPVNLVCLVVFIALLAAAYSLRRKVPLFEWMMHLSAAVPAMACAIALTVVMGFTAQREDGGGLPWISRMCSFWPFVLSYGWMMAIVGLATLNHLLRFKLREIPFLLNHLGLFIALVCGTLGVSDTQRLHLTTREGATEWRAADENGNVHELDFAVELHDFIMEEYPLQPGAKMRVPKRFASDMTVHTKKGDSVRTVIEVNKPFRIDGWKIYQYDYDEQMGSESEISVLELVRDPWQPFVLSGILMMLAGALTLFFFMTPRPKKEDAV